MTTTPFWRAILAGLMGLSLALPLWAQEEDQVDKETAGRVLIRPYSPYADRNYPTRVFFGDTHLHTAISLDAATVNTLGPEEAYRFARGEEVVSTTGQRAKLSRPLDFLVVADHAEAFGAMVEIRKSNPVFLADPTVKRWHDMIKQGGETALKGGFEVVNALSNGKIPPVMKDPKVVRSIRQNYTAISEKYNQPGRFTAFIGYEWTSNNSGNNLYRVVIFRDGADKATQIVPFSALDSENPADLWKALQVYEDKTGGQVLAIAHNGNLSNGRMFTLVDFMGNPLTRQYAETRANWEPLYEVTQIKGDGEAHKFLSPNACRSSASSFPTSRSRTSGRTQGLGAYSTTSTSICGPARRIRRRGSGSSSASASPMARRTRSSTTTTWASGARACSPGAPATPSALAGRTSS